MSCFSFFIVGFADISIRANQIRRFSMFEFSKIHLFYFFHLVISPLFVRKNITYRYPMPRVFSFWDIRFVNIFESRPNVVRSSISLDLLVVRRPYEYWVWVVAIFVSRAFCQFQSWPFPFSHIIQKKTFWLCIATLLHILFNHSLSPSQFPITSDQQAIILFWLFFWMVCARFTFYSIQNCNRRLKMIQNFY